MNINKTDLLEALFQSETYTEIAKNLGYDYYNGDLNNTIKSIINKYKLSTDHINPKESNRKKNTKYKRVMKECPSCNIEFEAREGHPKEKETCSHSCSNKIRTHNQNTKNKISKSLELYYENNKMTKTQRYSGGGGGGSRCKINSYKECHGCGETFIRANQKGNIDRKTCSDKCKIDAQVKNRTYQNGSRNPSYYFNSNTQEEVLLESSWEVRTAVLLDKMNIFWTRPESIQWVDKNNKSHRYYPDFYLKDYDIYLDPKNPYCMDRDKEKINKISEKVELIVGDIDKILSFIEDLDYAQHAQN